MTDARTVLISVNTSWNIYNFRKSLIRALKDAGYQVVSAAPPDNYSERVRSLVVQHIALPMQNDGTSPFHDFLLFMRYLYLLRTLRPSLVLTYTIKPNIYGALAARVCGVPIIPNVSGLGTAFIHHNWLTPLVKLLYTLAFARVFRVFFQNMEDRDMFVGMKLVAPEKTVVIPGSGVDLDYFNPSHNAVRDGSSPLAFVLIARLLWDKGIGEYVAAARIVKARYPEVTFSLVGPRGIKNRTSIPDATVEEWIREGIIDYRGETDQVRDVIAAHDCVVLPSYREGMSRVLLEAAAMGKPLIASDVAGCHHIIAHEKNGFLCAPHDAQNLAECMLRFIGLTQTERLRMGQESRAKTEQEFDEKLVITTYLNAIRQLTT